MEHGHPNYLFYTCKDGGCDFFEWCESLGETNEHVSPLTRALMPEDVIEEVNSAIHNIKDRVDSTMLVSKATLFGLLIVICLLLILLFLK